jgi:glycosyltransferase involved in cell wall biosynthesis
VLGYEPGNWEVYGFDSLAVSTFLADLDVFIHYHHSMYVEEYGRNIAEAMSLGVPCVLPPYYRATFGKAALYANVQEVGSVVRDLLADRELYVEMSSAALEYTQTYCSPDVGRQRLTDLMLTSKQGMQGALRSNERHN